MKIVKLVAIFCVLAGGIFLALSIGSLIKTTTSDDSSSKRIADLQERIAGLEESCNMWKNKYRELRYSVDNANKSPKLEEEAKARAEADAKARARAKLNAEAEAAEARAKAAEAEAERAQAKAEAARAEAAKAKARAVADTKAARAQADAKEKVRQQILALVNKKDIKGCRDLWNKPENRKFLTQNEKFAIEAVLDYRPKAPEGKKFDNLIVIKKEVEKYLKTVGQFKDYNSLLVAREEILKIEIKHLEDK